MPAVKLKQNICDYGIAPYLAKILGNRIKDSDIQAFVILFDESLNESMQKKQLDYHVRIWIDGTVVTRYLTSHFLGKARAIDLLSCFRKVDETLSLKNMIQISMDGPNVNLLSHTKVEEEILGHSLLNIGSCGLHQVHNAVKAATHSNGWGVGNFLSALFILFKDVPARREEYETVTSSTIFPMKFCKHRWAENIKPAKRAIEMVPNLRKFITAMEKKQKGVTIPKCHSFETVRVFVVNPLAIPKLAFFNCMLKPIEDFLVIYQTDAPMAPFLVDDLSEVVKTCLRKFVKSDIIDDYKYKPLDIDLDDEKNLKKDKLINVGFQAEQLLTELVEKKKINSAQVIELKTQARGTMKTFVKRIKVKSPIHQTLARKLSCINPSVMVEQQYTSEKKFAKVLKCFVEATMLQNDECDKLTEQFSKFVSESSKMASFKEFKKCENRLDELFFNSLSDKKEYKELWAVISKMLLISHGQATVERGFSANKQAIEVNQSETSLISRRTIKDHIDFVGGLKNVVVPEPMINSCSQARQRYLAHQSEKKKEAEVQKRGEKRKPIHEELDQLKKKRKTIIEDKEKLQTEANSLYDKAEQTSRMYYITKGNALRKSAVDKEE